MDATKYEPQCNGTVRYSPTVCLTPIQILVPTFTCLARVEDGAVFLFSSYADGHGVGGHWRSCTGRERALLHTAAETCEPPSSRTDCEAFDPKDGGCPDGCYDARGQIFDTSRRCGYLMEREDEVLGCISGADPLPEYRCFDPDWSSDELIVVPRQTDGLPDGWTIEEIRVACYELTAD